MLTRRGKLSTITLITGGSRSGKSSYAEKILQHTDSCLYIATATITDEEMRARVKKHRESRNQKWKTFEGFKNLGKVVSEYKGEYIMLDCVTNMISNLMFDGENLEIKESEKDELFKKIKNEFEDLINSVRDSNKKLVMVTNEVGMSLVSEYPIGRMFTDFQGFINQYLALESDKAVFMVSGLPMVLKGGNEING